MNKIVAALRDAVDKMSGSVMFFVEESNRIEGIHVVKQSEVEATQRFLQIAELTTEDVCAIQAVYAPGMPLRDRIGMNVRVGNYVAPGGGRNIQVELIRILDRLNRSEPGRYDNPWQQHVEFERLHPFMDGNGRTGRALWAWHMLRLGLDPFALPFLHRFYYQTLENDPRR